MDQKPLLVIQPVNQVEEKHLEVIHAMVLKQLPSGVLVLPYHLRASWIEPGHAVEAAALLADKKVA